MKIAILGDVHLRTLRPISRKDDILETALKKLKYVLDYCVENKITCLIQPGDLFDNPTPTYFLMNKLCVLLNNYSSISIVSVMGQHDMIMRSLRRERTAIGLLESMGFINILSHIPFYHFGANIFGRSWDESYCDVIKGCKQGTNKKNVQVNILVTHDDIGTKAVYCGQAYTKATAVLNKITDFDLIVCGDQHYTFTLQTTPVEGPKRYITNAGPLLRLTRSDILYKPVFQVYDTLHRTLNTVKIPFQPAEEVFTEREVNTESAAITSQTLDFIEQLRKMESTGTDFLNNLRAYLNKVEASPQLRALIAEVLHEQSEDIG